MAMHKDLAGVARELVSRFQSQKPLRGGSLIVTMFGDAILPRGGTASLGSLIKAAAPFGLNERLVRTAASRLVNDEWLRSRRQGKLSEYLLTETGRERFEEATSRIYGSAQTVWTGSWTLIVLPALRGAGRRRLREQLAWLGFGEFSSGIFAHPDLPPATLKQVRAAAAGLELFLFDAKLDDAPACAALAAAGWDLADLHTRYGRFVKRFTAVEQALSRPGASAPAAAFVIRTLLIHEYRKLHLRDPLLPSRLLPQDWGGAQAAALCRRIYSGVFRLSERYLSESVATLAGPLPDPDPSVWHRFGGLDL
jgi:phenylacetic acid degradation operon negative regulatory protein